MNKGFDKLKQKLSSKDPQTIARYCGACLKDRKLCLDLLGETYNVRLPEFEVYRPDGTEAEGKATLILDYLSTTSSSSSIPRGQGEWISFRELPNGGFYSDNFKRNTETKLSRKFDGAMESFREVCSELDGEPLAIGDAGYSFQVFPRFRMAFVFWNGGEEFSDRVNVLFESVAGECLSAEGLSIVGKSMSGRILKEAEERGL